MIPSLYAFLCFYKVHQGDFYVLFIVYKPLYLCKYSFMLMSILLVNIIIALFIKVLNDIFNSYYLRLGFSGNTVFHRFNRLFYLFSVCAVSFWGGDLKRIIILYLFFHFLFTLCDFHIMYSDPIHLLIPSYLSSDLVCQSKIK